IFAATHFTGGLGWMLPTFAMGCVFSWLVVRTGSLYSSFICHAAFNFTSGFVVAPMFVRAQKLSAVSAGGEITLTGVFPAWWIVLSLVLVATAVVLLVREFSRLATRVDAGAKHRTTAN
ncbi:MAG: CPBP family intramembrane metalloprotease, partial [Verrucomicrobia bacterium]